MAETLDMDSRTKDDSSQDGHEDKNLNTEKKLPYPKAIPFIISNEFCERFMYYGMRTVLVLYLTRKLIYDDDTATIIYHVFGMMVYFMSIFGAILSDSWLGKFKTIFFVSIVYAIGSIIVSIGAIPTLYLPGREITILGLVLIAIGSGGIKPCVAAFGGDQFVLPQQEYHMEKYFSIFYFSINCGSTISSFVTPILRHDVYCFGDDDCFPLAFGLPAMLMVISIAIFLSGKVFYNIKPVSGNMLVKVSKCITTAIRTKFKNRKMPPKTHWLDYAEDQFGKQLVNDTKTLLKVLVLYIPLPVFWALYDQQGSRWTFQATRMNGDTGLFEIKPDQMLVLSSVLILVLIPLYDVIFYPLLAKIGLRRPLQKLTWGGILAGLSFVASGLVELQLEKTYPVLPQPGESQLRIFNTFPCDYTIQTNIPAHETIFLKSLNVFEEKHIDITETTSFRYEMMPGEISNDCPLHSGTFNLKSAAAVSYFGVNGKIQDYIDNPDKSRTGDPLLRVLLNSKGERQMKIVDHRTGQVRFNGTVNHNNLTELLASTYQVTVDGTEILTTKIDQGAVLTLSIFETDSGAYESNLFEISAANSMSILWLIPQYVIIAFGEVMYSVTGLQFSYSQAPESMKSVIQSFWLLTTAFGNLIDIIIVGANIFDSQAMEFFLFAGIMFVDMAFFILLAWRYKSVDSEKMS